MDGKEAVKYEDARVLESSTRGHGILGPDVSAPLKFGASDTHSGNGNVNSGLVVVRMDELRIRNGAASAAWVSADYAQQNSDTFLDYGIVMSSFAISPIAPQSTTSAEELEADLKPVVTVSNLFAGVELVLGQDYTVSYFNNHAFGVATATATGIGNYAGKSASTTFDIHCVKEVAADYALEADEDWSAFESVKIASDVQIDLMGHKLTISGLSGSGTVTDTVGGGQLLIDVRAGYPVTISDTTLTGKLMLVKTGSGMLSAAKNGQNYTGETRIVSGVVKYACSNKNIDDKYPFGYKSDTDKGTIIIEEEGVLDPAGSYAWGNHTLIINGGMISNTVSASANELKYGIFNPKTTINGDFTFATLGDYGWTVPDLAGHTVMVDIASGKKLYVATPSKIDSFDASGRINIVRGGSLATFEDRITDLHAIDLDRFNAAANLSGTISVRDYRPQLNGNYGKGSAALNVYGTFTPESDYFYGPTMQKGSTIDLSNKTGVWSIYSSLTDGGNSMTKFSDGATINIVLGEHKLHKDDKIISCARASFQCNKWHFRDSA